MPTKKPAPTAPSDAAPARKTASPTSAAPTAKTPAAGKAASKSASGAAAATKTTGRAKAATAAALPPGPPNEGLGSAMSTIAGPARSELVTSAAATESQVRLARKMSGTEALAAAMPSNENKAAEHGRDNAVAPPQGTAVDSPDDLVSASTVAEDFASDKVGDGMPELGYNPTNESLDRVRVDSNGQALTTNQGVRVADNQNSLKAGLRGPTLMEDFILREKITHFDHERIPERVVHARGSAAHGYFEAYEALDDLTVAAPFAAPGKRTPVFVRFSTVAGERGSTDTARDVRGFAVKFYTDEGNWTWWATTCRCSSSRMR